MKNCPISITSRGPCVRFPHEGRASPVLWSLLPWKPVPQGEGPNGNELAGRSPYFAFDLPWRSVFPMAELALRFSGQWLSVCRQPREDGLFCPEMPKRVLPCEDSARPCGSCLLTQCQIGGLSPSGTQEKGCYLEAQALGQTTGFQFGD